MFDFYLPPEPTVQTVEVRQLLVAEMYAPAFAQMDSGGFAVLRARSDTVVASAAEPPNPPVKFDGQTVDVAVFDDEPSPPVKFDAQTVDVTLFDDEPSPPVKYDAGMPKPPVKFDSQTVDVALFDDEPSPPVKYDAGPGR